MTFDVKRSQALADALATTGPHSYYPTDAECVAAGEQLQAACDEIERLDRERNETARDRDDFIRETARLQALVREACDIGERWLGQQYGGEVESEQRGRPAARRRLAAIRAAAGGDS